MKKSYILLPLALVLGLLLSSFYFRKPTDLKNKKVLNLLVELGDKKPLHYYETLDSEKVKQGFEIVTKGFTQKDNKKTKIQSKHFTCIDCHNTQIEDPDLSKSDPEARLDLAIEKNMPFLPATTMAGVVNRETWYNDDYLKKYGELVAPARDTLRNAIHLCAVQCSQGRALEDWEMEAVVQYFLSIGHEVSNLKLSETEINQIDNALKANTDKEKAIQLIKSKYMTYSPATFMSPQPKNDRLLGKNGDPKRGEKIYELSCLTCHNQLGITNYKLDDSKLTMNHLAYWLGKDTFFSIYNISRKGTYAMNGYKPYMPNYTKERLSDKQLEDLAAYINQEAK